MDSLKIPTEAELEQMRLDAAKSVERIKKREQTKLTDRTMQELLDGKSWPTTYVE